MPLLVMPVASVVKPLATKVYTITNTSVVHTGDKVEADGRKSVSGDE
jgi:hypothetical protein